MDQHDAAHQIKKTKFKAENYQDLYDVMSKDELIDFIKEKALDEKRALKQRVSIQLVLSSFLTFSRSSTWTRNSTLLAISASSWRTWTKPRRRKSTSSSNKLKSRRTTSTYWTRKLKSMTKKSLKRGHECRKTSHWRKSALNKFWQPRRESMRSQSKL